MSKVNTIYLYFTKIGIVIFTFEEMDMEVVVKK